MFRAAERSYYLLSGALLILGSVLFLWGGSQHPGIRLGAGDLEYFRGFAEHIVRHSNWEGIHGGILVGPVLWALGAVALRDLLHRAGEKRWSTLGLVALVMAAVCWSVAFVFDGFVAPSLARALLESSDNSQAMPILAIFRANQFVVIRMGLVSWILLGGATAIFAVSLAVAPAAHRAVRWALALIGVILGVFPLLAWWGGTFAPGPFISPWWNVTAISTAFWYMAAGSLLITAHSGAVVGQPAAAASEGAF